MEMLNGKIVGQLPFKDLDKVSDLVFYDGPILSHFKDKYGKDILFYWVDYDENYNRWLVFQVSKDELYAYLSRRQSLKSLIENPFNDIYYSVEIGDDIIYNNVTQIFKDELSGAYIPKKDAMFASDVPRFYEKSLKLFEERYSKIVFMDSSLFMKANPAEQGKNLNLVGILDGADVLYGLGASFKGLTVYEATNEFVKRGIADTKRISKATNALVKAMQPNIVETKAASFAVAISPNSYTDVGEQFLNKQWRDNLFQKFKNDIVEIDKKNSEEIDAIIAIYGENNTTEIYKPLIDLYNNKNIVLSITDKDFRPKRTIRPVKKEYAQKLVVRKAKDEEEPEDRIAKVKYYNRTGKIAGTSGATLFDQSIYTSWKATEIRTEKKTYKLQHVLTADYRFENKLHIIENDELDIFASGDSLPEAETNFQNEFADKYEYLFSKENKDLSFEEINKKNYLVFFVGR